MKTINFFIVSLIFLVGCERVRDRTDTKNMVLKYTVEAFHTNREFMEVSLELINHSDTTLSASGWELHWNQMKGFVDKSSLPDNVAFEWVNGDYYRLKITNAPVQPGEKYVLSFRQNGIMDRLAMGPVGVFVVNQGTAYNVSTTILWEDAQGIEGLQLETAESRYASLAAMTLLDKNELDWVIPTPNKTQFTGQYRPTDSQWSVSIHPAFDKHNTQITGLLETSFPVEISALKDHEAPVNFKIDADTTIAAEAYGLTIDDKKITILASDYSGIFYAVQSLRQILTLAEIEDTTWPIIEIVDQPRFQYRGFLLDISRNFYGIKKIKQVLDIMSFFKLNYLDFRLTDDEGWRLQIPGLPELTEVGAKRGYTVDERDRLIPMYGSGAHSNTTGSGFLSAAEFTEIIHYANERNIKIMPQISFPSHARAAIKAMHARYLKYLSTGDSIKAHQYRLNDPKDESRYRSAQNYDDNIICICNESAYTFFEKILDEIMGMYQSAGVPLERFSIGADELPYGVWTASPECDAFIKNNDLGIRNIDDLYRYNLNRLKNILTQRNIVMTAWEDILLDHSDKSQGETKIKADNFDYEVIPYVWNNSWGEGREDMIYKFANRGFKTVMSNSSAFYFDMTDDKDIDNFGLNWSGYVDYFDTWGTDPTNVFGNVILNEKHGIRPSYIEKTEKLLPSKTGNLIGVQSQLWTETVRSEAIFDELFSPNVIVFAERAWSDFPLLDYSQGDITDQKEILLNSWNHFSNTLGQRMLPVMDQSYPDLAYDIPKPGGILKNDSLFVKFRFPGLQIKYTLDGSIPTSNAPSYTTPIQVDANAKIVLRAFSKNGRGGKSSFIN